jgi:hypothetical protein
MHGTGITIHQNKYVELVTIKKSIIMIKEENTHEMHELTQPELLDISGGGDADDLAYDVTYALITTNPLFWAARYNKLIYDKIFG